FLLFAEGTSVITERIFEDRFGHAGELRRLGGRMHVEGRTAVIHGVPELSGAPVTATNLRMGAPLIVAALAAQGETVLEGVAHIDRGYENVEEKLRGLGAELERVEVEAEIPHGPVR